MYTIFSQKEIKEKLLIFLPKEIPNYAEKIKAIQKFQKAILSSKIKTTKEESLQADFLNLFFGEILGYDYQNPKNWSLEKELKSKTDQTKVDGALGYFSMRDNTENNQKPIQNIDVRAIIELKSANYNLDKPQYRKDFKGSAVAQAFSYVSKQGGNCKWVLVSNFLEIRLYASNDQSRYEKFDILELDQDQNFRWFYFLLSKERLFKKDAISPTLHLYQNKLEKEENITKEYYAHYSELRVHFLQHLIENNPHQNPFDLLEYTQLIIDRLVFVCFVKDLELISIFILDKLQKSVKELYDRKQEKFWHELLDFFDALDKGFNGRVPAFNGGLFKEKEELKKIHVKNSAINNLFQLTKYDYQSDLNVNILGHIFEQSLSDIEALKEQIAQTGNVTLNEKQLSLRKTNGIFYTPEYITQYMVKESVGVWLEERKEELLEKNTYSVEKKQFWLDYKTQLESIKVLDPSCGSGAFLVQVFDFLWAEWQIVIREIEKFNTKNEANSSKTAQSLNLVVSSDEFSEDKIKKHIVSKNLFGVDLNFESVEITRLALWLKTASKKETLADLSPTIKRGNSLISDKAISNFAFDWKTEFLHGFDVIVGNPPYVSHERIEHKSYLQKNYQTFEAFGDLYILFYEKAISLLNSKGVLSFITSNSFLKAEYGSSLRNLILENHHILQLINLEGSKIFEDATVSPIILISKEKTGKEPKEIRVLNHSFSINNAISFDNFVKENQFYYPSTQTNFWTLKSTKEIELLAKIKGNHKTLENYETKIRLGIATGANEVFIIDEEKRQEFLKKNFKNNEIIKPVLRGRDINRYRYEFANLYVLLTPNEIDVKNEYPDIYNYLDSFDENFKNRGAKGKHWTNLRATSFLEDFKEEKIIWIELSNQGRFALCKEEIYLLNSAYFLIPPKEFESSYILAILNSKLIQFYLKSIANTSGAGTSRWINQYVKSFPIPFIPLENQKEISEKVTQFLKIQSKIEKQNKGFIQLLKTEFEEKINTKKLEKWIDLKTKAFIQEITQKEILSLKKKKEWQQFFEDEKKIIVSLYQQLNQLDSQIDTLIFELYQINQEEKQIIFDSLD
ncbi:MAG: hypothetical protein COZ18_07055 [Flexibacter sp. CG_4_10_14_3_um_filter_32_15]|nr:MAG: hypothetical protein COZ18_07055 [Flexibacter sp. CG_4_10_14_3_um_filter_32_15]